jgi:hypothetical protein
MVLASQSYRGTKAYPTTQVSEMERRTAQPPTTRKLSQPLALRLVVVAQVNMILALLVATATTTAAESRIAPPCPNEDLTANGYQQCAMLNAGESRDPDC